MRYLLILLTLTAAHGQWQEYSTNAPGARPITPPAPSLVILPWTGSDTMLLAAAASGAYQMLTVQYDQNLTPTNAVVRWPDGTFGTFTATNLNATWFAVDGYTVTYTNRNKTIAQPAVLRDENGCVTNAPALVIGP